MAGSKRRGHNRSLPFRSVYQRKHQLVVGLRDWGAANYRNFPWREPGQSLYRILVAELLLKRTTATAAAKAYPAFLARFPSLESLSHATVGDLEEALAPVGLQTQRAKSIKSMTAYLLAEYGGRLPCTLQELSAVPALGPYSARALLTFGLGKAVAVSDTNVRRILRRVFAKAGTGDLNDDHVQALADALLPDDGYVLHNYALLDLGSAVCRYDRPRCERCPIEEWCDSAGTRQ